MLAKYQDLSFQKDFRILSYQKTCLSIRSWKIQRKLDLNSAFESYLESATESLEREEVWNPDIAAHSKSLQIQKFSWLSFWIYFYRSMALHFASLPLLVW